MNQEQVGAFLKTLRNEKEWTQEELAEMLGVSNRSISRWETGKNLPDLSILLKFTELYGVKISEIISGKKESGDDNMESRENGVIIDIIDYYEKEQLKFMKWFNVLVVFGALCCIGYIILEDEQIGNLCLSGMCGSMLVIALIMVYYFFIQKSELGIGNKLKRSLCVCEGKELAATIIYGMKNMGGFLYVKEEGCRFIPHKYNFTKQEVSIDFDEVKNIVDGKFGLIVTMKTGERYKLVLEKQDRDYLNDIYKRYLTIG